VQVPPHLRSVDPATKLPVPVSITVADERSTPMPQPLDVQQKTISFAGRGNALGSSGQGSSSSDPNQEGATTFGNIEAVVPIVCAICMGVGWSAGWKPSWGIAICGAAVLGLLGLRALPASLWGRSLQVDSSKPITTIRVRQPSGECLRRQFNTTHTVADIYRWLDGK